MRARTTLTAADATAHALPLSLSVTVHTTLTCATSPPFACSPRHEEAFEKSGIVEELQVDLSIDKHVDNAFKRDSGTWDYVFHFAAENSMGLDDAVYAQKVQQ